MEPDSILHNAKIATNGLPSFAEAIAIEDGRISAVGTSDEILLQRGPATKVIDVGGRNSHPWPERLAHASDPWRPQLQYGTALGWRAVVIGRFAHAKGSGGEDAGAAMGPDNRWVDRVPVRGAPNADFG